MESSSAILAFDLGGTRLKAGLVDTTNGDVANFYVCDSAGDLQGALAALEEAGGKVLGDTGDCRAVGLCVPGLVDQCRTVVALPGKLDGIVGFDLRGWLQSKFGRPATVMNDAIAFGWGEAVHGGAAGHERCVVVTIGTGVGVSVFERGRPISAGPLGGGLLGGQIPIAIDPDGPTDTNGRSGTIEAQCAADRIVDAAQAEGCAAASVPDVYDAHRRGDAAAIRGVDAYRRQFGRALVALGHAHTPSAIVLGGGPMIAGNPILPGLEGEIAEQLWPGYSVVVRRASLGDRAALVGLACSGIGEE